MTQDNNSVNNQRNYFQAGYRLGLAKDAAKFNNMETALKEELVKIENHYQLVIEKGRQESQKTLADYKALAEDLKKMVDNLKQERHQFIKLLELESGIWSTLQNMDASFYVDIRSKIFEVLGKIDKEIVRISELVSEEARTTQLTGIIERMSEGLKTHLQEETARAWENIRDLRKGYGIGSGLSEQMDSIAKELDKK